MRIPATLTFFIDDCHVSATVFPKSGEGQVSVMTSEKKGARVVSDNKTTTLSLLKELCKDVRDWISKKEAGNYTIVECRVVLSPSWYLTKTASIVKESLKSIFFNEQMILDASGEDPEKKDLILIEKEISHILLNGYPVERIDKQKATLCKAAVYSCYMSRLFYNQISELIETITHNKENITFHSLAKVNIEHSKKVLMEKNDLATLKSGNLIIINFCTYITEIIYIHTETVIHIISLPIGFKETLHSLNSDTSGEHAVTESLLEMFLQNKLKPESRALVVELLEKSGRDWANMVMQGISQIPKTPDSMTKLFVYAVDKQQSEIAKMFTHLLPFNSNNDTETILFNNIIAL